MNLDTRRPVLVLLGAWNPAVFSPQWAAAHLYGIQDGAEISLDISYIQPNNKTVAYIHDVGYYVDNTRFEIYANSFSNDLFGRVGELAQRLLEKLPHTPLGDFGINFHFNENDPSNDLIDKLTSNDQLESRFRILAQEFTAKILYKEKCQLNFKRIVGDKSVVFDFNYHHPVQSPKDLGVVTGEYLCSLLNESRENIRELYDVEDCEQVQHEFTRQNEIGETQQ